MCYLIITIVWLFIIYVDEIQGGTTQAKGNKGESFFAGHAVSKIEYLEQ